MLWKKALQVAAAAEAAALRLLGGGNSYCFDV
jgi:hypothetical protein